MSARPRVPYLFSVDLEDVRNMIPNGHSYRAAVPECTAIYLRFLKSHGSTCTFFVVGDMLRTYPDLIRRIVDEGHEIACHTDRHVQLDKQNTDGFREDLEAWFQSAAALGISHVTGFRSPTYSLIEKTAWAYPILHEFGFTYSSSVLPAKNPLYGWPGFGRSPRVMDGIVEIPINLVSIGLRSVPFGGGVYFRLFPWMVLKQIFLRSKARNEAVVGYFHPYDVDVHQERFMHPDLDNSRLLNALMFIGRGSVTDKLDRVLGLGFEVVRYDRYAATLPLSDPQP